MRSPGWIHPISSSPVHCCHPDHLSNLQFLAEPNPLHDSYPLLPPWPPFKSAVGSWAWVRSPGWTHPTFSSPLHCCKPWPPFRSEVPGRTHPTSCLLYTAANPDYLSHLQLRVGEVSWLNPPHFLVSFTHLFFFSKPTVTKYSKVVNTLHTFSLSKFSFLLSHTAL